jgi:glycosyltransferase involved in cell wall biosynthesis
MKFSIAMTTFNGERYLREQLESICNQARLPDEVIICDDRSGDRTVEMIREFAVESPFPVRVIENAVRLGVTRNLEKSIGLCEGELIALCDQDDIWRTDKLEKLEQVFIARREVGLVFTDAELIDEASQPTGNGLWRAVGFDRKKQRMIAEGRAVDLLLAQCVVTGSTVAFRSKFRDTVLPLNAEGFLFHDGWWTLIIAAIADIAFIQEPLMKYRQHSEQQIGTRGMRGNLLRTRKTDRSCYLVFAGQFEEMYDRLTGNGRSTSNRVLGLIQDKIAHLHARAAMPPQRLRRLPLILRESVNRHYTKFSRGLASAAKDFLF